jgi:hypothetical protein
MDPKEIEELLKEEVEDNRKRRKIEKSFWEGLLCSICLQNYLPS